MLKVILSVLISATVAQPQAGIILDWANKATPMIAARQFQDSWHVYAIDNNWPTNLIFDSSCTQCFNCSGGIPNPCNKWPTYGYLQDTSNTIQVNGTYTDVSQSGYVTSGTVEGLNWTIYNANNQFFTVNNTNNTNAATKITGDAWRFADSTAYGMLSFGYGSPFLNYANGTVPNETGFFIQQGPYNDQSFAGGEAEMSSSTWIPSWYYGPGSNN
jgi:hypothetical protein